MTKITGGRLIVLGTMNQDHVAFIARQPEPGETVLAQSFSTGTGGKGANQAVAAARAGANVTLISAVGDDDAGRALRSALAGAGVDDAGVMINASSHTGVAFITVSDDGENSIVVAPGAASAIDPVGSAAAVTELIRSGDVFLTQLELPQAVVDASCRAANAHGARVVLNYSPVRGMPDDVLAMSNPIILNAGEATSLAGFEVRSRDDAERAALEISTRTRSVVITLGGEGVVARDSAQSAYFPAPAVTVVDSTGAGDSFAGALAAALTAGESLNDAIRKGVIAGSNAVQHRGAQPPE